MSAETDELPPFWRIRRTANEHARWVVDLIGAAPIPFTKFIQAEEHVAKHYGIKEFIRTTTSDGSIVYLQHQETE